MLRIKKNRASKNDKKPYGNWKKSCKKNIDLINKYDRIIKLVLNRLYYFV